MKVVLVEPGGFKTGIWEEIERDIDKRRGLALRRRPTGGRCG